MILLLSTGPLKIVVAKPHWHLHRLDLLSGLQEKKDPKQWPIHPQRTTPNAIYSQIWSLTKTGLHPSRHVLQLFLTKHFTGENGEPGKTSQQPIQIIQSKWPLRTAFWGVCAPRAHSPQADNVIYGFEWHAFDFKLCIVAAGHNDQTLTWSAGDVVIWCYMCLLWVVVWPMIGTHEEETRSFDLCVVVCCSWSKIHPSPASTIPWIFSMTLSTSAHVNGDFTSDCGATKLVMDFFHHIMNLVRLHSFGPMNGHGVHQVECICIYEMNIDVLYVNEWW